MLYFHDLYITYILYYIYRYLYLYVVIYLSKTLLLQTN